MQNFSFFLAFPSLYSPTHYLNFLVEIGNKKNFTSECRQVRKRTEMTEKPKFCRKNFQVFTVDINIFLTRKIFQNWKWQTNVQFTATTRVKNITTSFKLALPCTTNVDQNFNTFSQEINDQKWPKPEIMLIHNENVKSPDLVKFQRFYLFLEVGWIKYMNYAEIHVCKFLCHP